MRVKETVSPFIMTPLVNPSAHRFVDLLIIQPTPFCNINCDYCYLPNRDSAKRMPLSVLKQTVEKVFASDMVGEQLSIVWHAGEPLALPIKYYEEAFAELAKFSFAGKRITHSIQTNGTLINDRWCEFIKEHSINLGLSIDGPDFIHDAHRKTRSGRGTHEQVMKGVEALRRNGVDFHVIAVITAQSVDHPDEIFNFFLQNGMQRVGFNIEEIEDGHEVSTLAKDSSDRKIRSFFARMHQLQKGSGGAVKIREFDRAYMAIAQSFDPAVGNDQVTPFKILSVDCEGNFSTFSPELLGAKSSAYGDFCFGNILTDDFDGAAEGLEFKRVWQDIEAGVRLCSETCEYYSLCGGGAPSNKYFENGTFNSAETMYCRYSIQIPIDIVLADLEESLSIDSTAQQAVAK